VRGGDASTFPQRVIELGLSPTLEGVLRPLLEVIDGLNTHLRQADRELEQMARSSAVVQRLCTVPGVGPVTALAFVSTVDQIARFHGAHQVESYLGLVPSERSSGEKQRRGHITKAGNSRMRYLLVEAAWRVVRSRRADVQHLRQWFARVATRRGRRIATVALARRLAGILYALWRDGRTYQPHHQERAIIA
jgi:transposase